jgi:hypothetical protein
MARGDERCSKHH